MRWILVAVLTLAVAGAAYACDSAKSTTKTASASVKSACADKKIETAKAAGDCKYCDLVTNLRANEDKVLVSAVETEDGVELVFAASGKENVSLAQQLATDAYGLMAGPAKCDYTRAAMAKKSCGDCSEGMKAFAGTNVVYEDTEEGALARVTTKDEKQVEKLHAFFKNLHAEHGKTEG